MTFPVQYYNKFKEAIKAYNEYFKEGSSSETISKLKKALGKEVEFIEAPKQEKKEPWAMKRPTERVYFGGRRKRY